MKILKVKKKKLGFTLVEMVVTLLIIVTLALLSFPLYEGRTNESSKLAEGYALLGAIIDAQISYYNEWGNFYARVGNKAGGDFWTAVEPELGINAINNRYFTWFNACDGTGGSWYNLNGDGNFKYRFMAVVRSANAGTITIQYNLTQRFEPVVSGI